MTLGAEPRKVAILGVLLAVASYLVYSNIIGGGAEDTASAAAPSSAPAALPPIPTGETAAAPPRDGTLSSRRSRDGGGSEEFRPSLKPREGKDRVDPAKIDPTLELYRLERLQASNAPTGGRNLFEFGAPPPPPPVKDVKIVPKPVAEVKPPEVVAPPPTPPAPVKPQAPPIPLKYYGFSQKEFEAKTMTGAGARRGLFLRGGEEIFVASEGELIDRRYKVVRVQAGSATLMDTQFDHEQTLPIEKVPE